VLPVFWSVLRCNIALRYTFRSCPIVYEESGGLFVNNFIQLSYLCEDSLTHSLTHSLTISQVDWRLESC
jgi:hypothetical protein